MKKNFIIIIVVIILLVAAFFILNKNESSTLKKEYSKFHVNDTSSITMIYMADKNNHQLRLRRISPGTWKVNDKFTATKRNMDVMLETLLKVRVREPVSEAGHDNIVKVLASAGTKVEVYQKVPRVNLFDKIKLFYREKLTKTFYVGPSTQDNQGTFMIIEDAPKAYITYIPGFRGFLNSRFSVFEKDWRDRVIIRKNINQIEGLTVEYPANPEESYQIRRTGERSFALQPMESKSALPTYDTIAVLNLLSSFELIPCESYLYDTALLDSLKKQVPFQQLTLVDTSGTKTTVKTFRKVYKGSEIDVNTGELYKWDLDRMYALINDDQDVVHIQYYHFDPVARPLSFLTDMDLSEN